MLALCGCGRIDFGVGGDPAAACAAADLVDIRLGHESSIGIDADGGYWGMGANQMDELSIEGADFAEPQPLPALAGLSSVTLQLYASAAIDASGNWYTWGNGFPAPSMRSPMAGWTDPQVGWSFGCAIKQSDRSLWCYGDNYQGNLGDDTNIDRDMPIQVPIPAVASYMLGSFAACAIDTAGALWCWGADENGQAGDGTTTDQIAPTQIGTDTDWMTIGVGGYSTCALKTNGTLWCWGEGYLDGTVDGFQVPTQLGTQSNWIALGVGFDTSCAMASDHGVWCWGGNMYGELGTGNMHYVVAPIEQPLPSPADSMIVGPNNTCVTIGGHLWCWGKNDTGMLGVGTFANVTTPVPRCP